MHEVHKRKKRRECTIEALPVSNSFNFPCFEFFGNFSKFSESEFSNSHKLIFFLVFLRRMPNLFINPTECIRMAENRASVKQLAGSAEPVVSTALERVAVFRSFENCEQGYRFECRHWLSRDAIDHRSRSARSHPR